jgi:hypothetical protein
LHAGERVQDVLDGVGGRVGAEQHRRLVVVHCERSLARVVLAAGAVEALDRRAVAAAVDPGVASAELEAAERVGEFALASVPPRPATGRAKATRSPSEGVRTLHPGSRLNRRTGRRPRIAGVGLAVQRESSRARAKPLLGIAGLVAGMRVIPESTDETAPRRLDLPGLVVASAALFALTYALIKGNDLGWSSPAIVGLLAAALAGAVAFVVI